MEKKWIERFTALAELWATHSSCLRRQVGAVIVNPKTKAVISIGYNDTPTGAKNCGDGGCEVCQQGTEARMKLDCECIHGEMNALLLAARDGRKLDGMAIIATLEPCNSCKKHLAQAGVDWIKNDGGW